jgi:hypothetical protein
MATARNAACGVGESQRKNKQNDQSSYRPDASVGFSSICGGGSSMASPISASLGKRKPMKYILIALLVLASAVSVIGQTLCHDEYICTPMGGCRWISVCRQSSPAPAPPRPPQCHDEYICTPMGGCRWVTICK